MKFHYSREQSLNSCEWNNTIHGKDKISREMFFFLGKFLGTFDKKNRYTHLREGYELFDCDFRILLFSIATGFFSFSLLNQYNNVTFLFKFFSGDTHSERSIWFVNCTTTQHATPTPFFPSFKIADQQVMFRNNNPPK